MSSTEPQMSVEVSVEEVATCNKPALCSPIARACAIIDSAGHMIVHIENSCKLYDWVGSLLFAQ